MEKKMYWIVKSNFDLSMTIEGLDVVRIVIENDFADLEDDNKDVVEYTLTPRFLTDEEYEALPEAD